MIVKPKYLLGFVPLALIGAFLLWRSRRQKGFYIDGMGGVDGISGESNTNYKGPLKMFTETDFKNAVPALVKKYGKTTAAKVEQLFRWETAHFKSLQYKKCGSPGMEKHAPAPLYGWYAPFFVANPKYIPVGVYTMPENGTGISKTFVVMPSVEASAMFVADYITRYGNPGRWRALDKSLQNSYIASLNTVVPRFVNAVA